MTDHDDSYEEEVDQLISEFHEVLDEEQERDPSLRWDKSKQEFEPDEPTAEPKALRAPQIRPLDEVEERAISWFWPGRVALGRLTVVAGEPGAGASLLLQEIASRVSRGRSFPESDHSPAQSECGAIRPDLESPGGLRPPLAVPHEAAEVLLIMHEDLAQIVKPRLAALGADTKKFHVMGDVPDVTFIEETPCVRPFRAYKDLAHLDSYLASAPNVKLVVIDSLDLYLAEGNRSFPSKTLRELGEVAARRGVAIVAAARAPEVPGAGNLRRWLDKLSGVAELAMLFAVVRDRRRPCRRYLAAAKNTLADMDDALSFETPGGRVVWGRRRVSAAVCWATAARLDQEDAARWLREELALGPKTAKELRAAADEAGIPWHVVYRAKGIAGADCSRVGGGAGSYFVWSLFDLPEAEEEAEENAQSSIENTKTGEESGEREEVPDLVTEANAKCEMQNEKCELEEGASAEPTRFAGAPGPTEPSGNEVEDSQESAKSPIENTKRGVARGARRRQRLAHRRRHAEAKGEAAKAQNEFSDPTTDAERQEECVAPSAQPVEQACTQKGEGSTSDRRGICIRYGESEPILIASMSSNLLWNMLTKERFIPELKQEIERVLRERSDPRMNDKMKAEG